MENSDDKKIQPVPILGIMSICLAFLGVVVPTVVPLDSSRPVMSGKTLSMGWRGIEDVESRLWQDPFKAVSEHAPPGASDNKESYSRYDECYGKPNHHDFSALKVCIEKISKELYGHPNTKILILGVLVSGGPYAEDAEFRMRTRYAVLSGLASEGYFPSDSQHIGFFMGKPVTSKLPERIPFEWLEQEKLNEKSKDDTLSNVLLIWLDEESFETKPLETASLLKEAILESLNVKPDDILFRFLGPSRSETLLAMAEELRDMNHRYQDIQALVRKIGDAAKKIDDNADKKILNDNTVDALDASDALKKKLDDMGRPYKSIKQLANTFVNVSASISPQNYEKMKNLVGELPIRVTLTDNHLAQAMLSELKLRGVKLSCNDSPNFTECIRNNAIDHIVLISEWDTFYGREAFPAALKKSISALICETNASDKHCKIEAAILDQYSYMRGLDGAIPSENKAEVYRVANRVNGVKKKSSKEQDSQFDETVMERPEGESQKDYLRRLNDRISYHNQALLEQGGKGIRAIGVVGSDAYDKLMVLKALRPNFPGTLFFTTDLDARFLLSDEIDHTRNLIVASSFGLELKQSLQQKIPPFRDSYQTGYYLATKLLFCNSSEKSQVINASEADIARICVPQDDAGLEENKDKLQKDIEQSIAPPRIFELGLSRQPFNLNETCTSTGDVTGFCATVHPKKHPYL